MGGIRMQWNNKILCSPYCNSELQCIIIWSRPDQLIHQSIQNTFHILYHHKVLHVKQEVSIFAQTFTLSSMEFHFLQLGTSSSVNHRFSLLINWDNWPMASNGYSVLSIHAFCFIAILYCTLMEATEKFLLVFVTELVASTVDAHTHLRVT